MGWKFRIYNLDWDK